MTKYNKEITKFKELLPLLENQWSILPLQVSDALVGFTNQLIRAAIPFISEQSQKYLTRCIHSIWINNFKSTIFFWTRYDRNIDFANEGDYSLLGSEVEAGTLENHSIDMLMLSMTTREFED